jgi:ammonia channel protein AmtB
MPMTLDNSIIWTVAFTYIILKVLDAMMGLRVSEDQEVEGLDIVMHEETGYHNIHQHHAQERHRESHLYANDA